MRRPKFRGWVTRELAYLSGERTLNLRRLAYLAQTSEPRLRERLVLYAIATAQVERLSSYLYREDMINELEELAGMLRGRNLDDPTGFEETNLPPRYQKALMSYKTAYTRIDTRNDSKRLRWEKSTQLQKEKGVSNARIAQDLNLDPGNVNSYLKHGATERFSLENATRIMKYLYSL